MRILVATLAESLLSAPHGRKVKMKSCYLIRGVIYRNQDLPILKEQRKTDLFQKARHHFFMNYSIQICIQKISV